MLDEKSKLLKATETGSSSHQRISSNLNAQKFTIKELEQRYAFKSDACNCQGYYSPAIVKDTINYMKKYFRPSPNECKTFFLNDCLS
jgi:hypothetical protein